MPGFASYKLGKQAARQDPRTLKLSRYLAPRELPKPPAAVRWSEKAPTQWPGYRNTEIGCCGIASQAHQVIAWTANTGKLRPPSDDDVLRNYMAVGGYVPGNPQTDGGVVMLDAVKYWRSVGLAGRTIAAFASVEADDQLEVMTACWLFGGILIGAQLPVAAQTQPVWKAPVNPWYLRVGQFAKGSWGGHAVYVCDADKDGLTCITWGQKQRMSWHWLRSYCDEAYACLSHDWFDGTKQAPSGFDLATLEADLVEVGKP